MQMALYSKAVIFVVISVLVITYVSSATFNALAAGPISCNYKGTLTVTCCQDHIINRSPANPAGTLVRYCTDCTIGPGGYTGTVDNPFGNLSDCGERYIDMSAEQPPTPSLPTPPIAGENIVPGDTGVLEQPPTFSPFNPAAPLQGGVLEQPPSEGVIPPLKQGQGVLPRDGVLQQPPADDGTEGAAPLTVEPPTCPVGNVWDPDLMICVPDLPPVELCPDGSLPQPTGPGGRQPECPPSVAEQPQAEEPEQLEAEEPEAAEEPAEEEQPTEEEDGSEENGNN